jgi:hypothetical protein
MAEICFEVPRPRGGDHGEAARLCLAIWLVEEGFEDIKWRRRKRPLKCSGLLEG